MPADDFDTLKKKMQEFGEQVPPPTKTKATLSDVQEAAKKLKDTLEEESKTPKKGKKAKAGGVTSSAPKGTWAKPEEAEPKPAKTDTWHNLPLVVLGSVQLSIKLYRPDKWVSFFDQLAVAADALASIEKSPDNVILMRDKDTKVYRAYEWPHLELPDLAKPQVPKIEKIGKLDDLGILGYGVSVWKANILWKSSQDILKEYETTIESAEAWAVQHPATAVDIQCYFPDGSIKSLLQVVYDLKGGK